jgi:ribosomal protein S1
VVTVDEERRRLRLSFAPKTAADAAAAAGADPMGGLQPGSIVEGRVRSITTKEVRPILGKFLPLKRVACFLRTCAATTP